MTPCAQIDPAFRTLLRFLWSCLLACTFVLPAHGAVIYQLAQPTAQAGEPLTLQGLVFNDTGNALSFTPPARLSATLQDAGGRARTLRFELSTAPDTVSLPANTFARMAWVATMPAGMQGLLGLQVEGQPGATLALTAPDGHGVPAPTLAQAGGAGPAASGAPAAALQGPAQPSASSAFDRFRNAISPYEPIYFIVGNRDGADARFQLSFKYRLFSPADAAKPGFMDDWYFGFTQTSLWDLHSDSRPFVDTSYRPSLFWKRDSLWSSKSHDWSLGLNTGIEHASNGRSDEDSRSLNILYAEPALNYRFEAGSVLSFMPRFKYYTMTDREMRYPDYLGRIDWKLRWAQDDGVALTALYRQGADGRNAMQLEAAWPLRHTFLHMNGYLYAQYFKGYGETLLGYQHKSSPTLRLGIGFVH